VALGDTEKRPGAPIRRRFSPRTAPTKAAEEATFTRILVENNTNSPRSHPKDP
jgi:hypothetical protein